MRLIDADELVVELAEHAYDNKSFDEILDNIPTIKTIPKDQYEARLKADMVAILTEIQLEIEEQKRDELSYQQTWNYPLNVCVSIIQQKINLLKEQEDGKDN